MSKKVECLYIGGPLDGLLETYTDPEFTRYALVSTTKVQRIKEGPPDIGVVCEKAAYDLQVFNSGTAGGDVDFYFYVVRPLTPADALRLLRESYARNARN